MTRLVTYRACRSCAGTGRTSFRFLFWTLTERCYACDGQRTVRHVEEAPA